MKINQPKNLFLGIIVLMLFSTHLYAQGSWTLLKEASNVSVFYQIVPCSQGQGLDPTQGESIVDTRHETLQLKIENNNTASKNVTFSKVTKLDGTDEMEILSIPSGTKLLETCETSPQLMLTKQDGDQYPTSVTNFLEVFKLTIEN